MTDSFLRRQGVVTTFADAPLTAPGNTPARTVGGIVTLAVAYTLTGVSGTVIVRAEGSLDGVNWFGLDANGDTSHAANGVYAMRASDRVLQAVRFRVLSGTFASCAVTWRIANA